MRSDRVEAVDECFEVRRGFSTGIVEEGLKTRSEASERIHLQHGEGRFVGRGLRHVKLHHPSDISESVACAVESKHQDS